MTKLFVEQNQTLKSRIEEIEMRQLEALVSDEESIEETRISIREKSPLHQITDVQRTPIFKRSIRRRPLTPSKETPITKPVTNADLKVYQVGASWELWYKRFNMIANSCSWADQQRVATLCHFMPEEIKEFLQNLSADSFKDSNTLSKILEDLFDLYEKTDEEREKEFLNIMCQQTETIASFYLRFS